MFAWITKLFSKKTPEPFAFEIDVSNLYDEAKKVFRILMVDGKISGNDLTSICGKGNGTRKCINALRDLGMNIECKQKPIEGSEGHHFKGTSVEYIHVIVSQKN